ncbi:MAG: 1-acyl-sn-glycerol-3-phosphate acyltransferase [Proteobacteria bacterium]|nr:1-acyl-sn-glycerol-3-phosphate acyltransferase [Pseudomonadota bacterium]
MALARQIFYVFLIKPLLVLMLGLNVRHMDRLPERGPHVIAANHNSHLDAMVLVSLFRWSDIPKIKLAAAKDYFCRNAFMTWFSLNILGIIPIERHGGADNPLAPVFQALDKGHIVVIFPEGSRGEPEQRQPLKYGVAKLLEAMPEIGLTPVFMHGLGKSLPRGEALLVPFVCEINIGEMLRWAGDRKRLITKLDESFSSLDQEIAPKPWN